MPITIKMSSNQNCELATKALEQSIEKVIKYYEDTEEDSKRGYYFEDVDAVYESIQDMKEAYNAYIKNCK